MTAPADKLETVQCMSREYLRVIYGRDKAPDALEIRAMCAALGVLADKQPSGERDSRFIWCQPVREGEPQERVWVVRFEDQDRPDIAFTGPDAEAEARAYWHKANVAWNCYLLTSAPQLGDGPADKPGAPDRIELRRCGSCGTFAPGHFAQTCRRPDCPERAPVDKQPSPVLVAPEDIEWLHSLKQWVKSSDGVTYRSPRNEETLRIDRIVSALAALASPPVGMGGLGRLRAEEQPCAPGIEPEQGSETGDDLYQRAKMFVVRDQKGSTSYVQRRLNIGYNLAASLMERMEAEGILSGPNHAGRREVLVSIAAEAQPTEGAGE